MPRARFTYVGHAADTRSLLSPISSHLSKSAETRSARVEGWRTPQLSPEIAVVRKPPDVAVYFYESSSCTNP